MVAAQEGSYYFTELATIYSALTTKDNDDDCQPVPEVADSFFGKPCYDKDYISQALSGDV